MTITATTVATATSNKGANLDGASIVLPLKAFEKAPDEGFRLSRHIAKKDAKGSYNGLQVSKGVIIPDNLELSEAIRLPALRCVLRAALHTAQDTLIRSMLVNGKEQISHEAINLAAVEAYLQSQPETFGKLSADKIAVWFDAEAADVVVLRLALKRFGVEPVDLNEEQRKQVVKLAEGVMVLFQRAAERSPVWEEAIKVKLLAILADCPQSAMTEKLRNILSKEEAAEINFADAL